MATISGYSTIKINGIARRIATVQHKSTFYIWFEDVRDVNNFKTTGYIMHKDGDNKTTIIPANLDGILPDNVDDLIRDIKSTKPDWERQTPDAP